MNSGDTIVALGSAVGPAARIIVRASGPDAGSLATGLTAHEPQQGGVAVQSHLSFNRLTAPAWVYWSRAPRSYTGEDLVEFHLPGSVVLAKMLLAELIARGARPAEAGEFTARAYFNRRIDLTGAEGIAATIAAGTEQELAAARQLMAGELSRRLAPAMELLADTLALVEVGIDFTEEDVTFLSTGDLSERVHRVDGMLATLLTESARFERLAHEPRIVLVGRPNAGKSTLLNALADQQRAVVSPVAGTTRDVLSASVALRRGIVQVSDAAGIDESAPADDPGGIDAQMRERALRAAESADVLVLVDDVTDARPLLRLSREPDLMVFSKIDLSLDGRFPREGEAPVRLSSPKSAEPKLTRETRLGGSLARPGAHVCLSAVTGAGMPELLAHLDRLAFGNASGTAALALNLRHVRAITEARDALARARGQADQIGPEVTAVELREALDHLGGVLGRVTPDDLLGRIFSGFCIGK